MRRVLAVLGLIGLGVLLGFLVRLVWPRRGMVVNTSSAPVPGH